MTQPLDRSAAPPLPSSVLTEPSLSGPTEAEPPHVEPEVSSTDIAVVGRALRVPGARDVSEFWDNLSRGVESIRDLGDRALSCVIR